MSEEEGIKRIYQSLPAQVAGELEKLYFQREGLDLVEYRRRALGWQAEYDQARTEEAMRDDWRRRQGLSLETGHLLAERLYWLSGCGVNMVRSRERTPGVAVAMLPLCTTGMPRLEDEELRSFLIGDIWCVPYEPAWVNHERVELQLQYCFLKGVYRVGLVMNVIDYAGGGAALMGVGVLPAKHEQFKQAKLDRYANLSDEFKRGLMP